MPAVRLSQCQGHTAGPGPPVLARDAKSAIGGEEAEEEGKTEREGERRREGECEEDDRKRKRGKLRGGERKEMGKKERRGIG